MLEIIVIIAAVVGMVRLAGAENSARLLWGLVMGGACGLSLFIPLPFVRLGIAVVAVFVAWIIAVMFGKARR